MNTTSILDFERTINSYQHPNTNEPEELTKVNIMDFNYSVRLHHNSFINKSFRQEEEKFYEVSQDTDELSVHPIKFYASNWKPADLLWPIPFHFHPYLYIDQSVSTLVIGLLSGVGSLS